MKVFKNMMVRRVVMGLVLVLGIVLATGCYNPTYEIQSVIGYRQSVMDWSNDAWDAYIRE
jgi:hypothetical protein